MFTRLPSLRGSAVVQAPLIGVRPISLRNVSAVAGVQPPAGGVALRLEASRTAKSPWLIGSLVSAAQASVQARTASATATIRVLFVTISQPSLPRFECKSHAHPSQCPESPTPFILQAIP